MYAYCPSGNDQPCKPLRLLNRILQQRTLLARNILLYKLAPKYPVSLHLPRQFIAWSITLFGLVSRQEVSCYGKAITWNLDSIDTQAEIQECS